MSRLLLGVLTLGALLAVERAAAAETIRCESQDGRYQVCSADTRGGVRLTQQLSSQGCWENDTWGYERDRIWVDHGCRAEFRVGGSHSSNHDGAVAAALVIGLAAAVVAADKHDHDDDHRGNSNYDSYHNNYGNNYGYGGNPRTTLRCESKDNRFAYCSLPYRGHVEIYKQQSSSACVYGRSWGAESNRIWVSNGCRADFAVY